MVKIEEMLKSKDPEMISLALGIIISKRGQKALQNSMPITLNCIMQERLWIRGSYALYSLGTRVYYTTLQRMRLWKSYGDIPKTFYAK